MAEPAETRDILRLPDGRRMNLSTGVETAAPPDPSKRGFGGNLEAYREVSQTRMAEAIEGSIIPRARLELAKDPDAFKWFERQGADDLDRFANIHEQYFNQDTGEYSYELPQPLIDAFTEARSMVTEGEREAGQHSWVTAMAGEMMENSGELMAEVGIELGIGIGLAAIPEPTTTVAGAGMLARTLNAMRSGTRAARVGRFAATEAAIGAVATGGATALRHAQINEAYEAIGLEYAALDNWAIETGIGAGIGGVVGAAVGLVSRPALPASAAPEVREYVEQKDRDVAWETNMRDPDFRKQEFAHLTQMARGVDLTKRGVRQPSPEEFERMAEAEQIAALDAVGRALGQHTIRYSEELASTTFTRTSDPQAARELGFDTPTGAETNEGGWTYKGKTSAGEAEKRIREATARIKTAERRLGREERRLPGETKDVVTNRIQRLIDKNKSDLAAAENDLAKARATQDAFAGMMAIREEVIDNLGDRAKAQRANALVVMTDEDGAKWVVLPEQSAFEIRNMRDDPDFDPIKEPMKMVQPGSPRAVEPPEPSPGQPEPTTPEPKQPTPEEPKPEPVETPETIAATKKVEEAEAKIAEAEAKLQQYKDEVEKLKAAGEDGKAVMRNLQVARASKALERAQAAKTKAQETLQQAQEAAEEIPGPTAVEVADEFKDIDFGKLTPEQEAKLQALDEGGRTVVAQALALRQMGIEALPDLGDAARISQIVNDSPDLNVWDVLTTMKFSGMKADDKRLASVALGRRLYYNALWNPQFSATYILKGAKEITDESIIKDLMAKPETTTDDLVWRYSPYKSVNGKITEVHTATGIYSTDPTKPRVRLDDKPADGKPHSTPVTKARSFKWNNHWVLKGKDGLLSVAGVSRQDLAITRMLDATKTAPVAPRWVEVPLEDVRVDGAKKAMSPSFAASDDVRLAVRNIVVVQMEDGSWQVRDLVADNLPDAPGAQHSVNGSTFGNEEDFYQAKLDEPEMKYRLQVLRDEVKQTDLDAVMAGDTPFDSAFDILQNYDTAATNKGRYEALTFVDDEDAAQKAHDALQKELKDYAENAETEAQALATRMAARNFESARAARNLAEREKMLRDCLAKTNK